VEVRMKRCVKTIRRRKFLETGIAGVIIFAAQPFGKIFNFSVTADSHNKPDNSLSKDSCERLLQIIHKYGCEFGETKEGLNGCF